MSYPPATTTSLIPARKETLFLNEFLLGKSLAAGCWRCWPLRPAGWRPDIGVATVLKMKVFLLAQEI
jgi:hypothetical protein